MVLHAARLQPGSGRGGRPWVDEPGAAEQLLSIRTDVGTCCQAAPVTCALGTLQAGTGATITLQVKLTRTGPNQHAYHVGGTADNADANPNDNLGGVGFQVSEPEVPEVSTPTVDSRSASETGQTHLEIEARLAPYGTGTWRIEYGTSKAYGRRTAAQAVGGNHEVTRTATIEGLKRKTTYHFRAVLTVGGKTYRGRDATARTFGKVLYPEITPKAKRRTPTSTSYTGLVGPSSLVDTAAACAGSNHRRGVHVARRRPAAPHDKGHQELHVSDHDPLRGPSARPVRQAGQRPGAGALQRQQLRRRGRVDRGQAVADA